MEEPLFFCIIFIDADWDGDWALLMWDMEDDVLGDMFCEENCPPTDGIWLLVTPIVCGWCIGFHGAPGIPVGQNCIAGNTF